MSRKHWSVVLAGTAIVSVVSLLSWVKAPSPTKVLATQPTDAAGFSMTSLLGANPGSVPKRERPPQIAGTAKPETNSRAEAIYGALEANSLAQSCPEVMADVVAIVVAEPSGSALWSWSVERANECVGYIRDPGMQRRYLDSLLAAAPGDRGLLVARAWNQIRFGRFAEAAQQLEEALAKDEFSDGWDVAGTARLQAAREMGSGDADNKKAALLDAKRSLLRAIELGGSPPDPLTMGRLAEIELELGSFELAVSWADRAVQAVRHGSSEIANFAAANVYFNAGMVYFRTGQRDVGIAYMDQGISMVSGVDRDAFLSFKEQVLAGRA